MVDRGEYTKGRVQDRKRAERRDAQYRTKRGQEVRG